MICLQFYRKQTSGERPDSKKGPKRHCRLAELSRCFQFQLPGGERWGPTVAGIVRKFITSIKVEQICVGFVSLEDSETKNQDTCEVAVFSSTPNVKWPFVWRN